MNSDEPLAFLGSIPAFDRFEDVADLSLYVPLPGDWLLALADVVGSTEAIARGAYKSVNMAGAAAISAVSNAAGIAGLPFVFGGDGAFVAIPPGAEGSVRRGLAALAAWVARELSLKMRVAVVPLSAIRAAGHDVRVARYRASAEVSYAMITGGGAAWAEAAMKRGEFAVEAGNGEDEPDLTGLSCRWAPVPSRMGEIVSVIVVPADPARGREFSRLVADLAALTSEGDRGGNPIPAEGPPLSVSRWGVSAEANQARGWGRRQLRRLGIWIAVGLVLILHRIDGRLGRFHARTYTRDIAMNADFRKFDDGLKMTIDVTPASRLRIESLLKEAKAAGVCRYSLLVQESALMTCIVPTPLGRDHMHFIDGGSGGYAAAASLLKAEARRPPPA